MKLKLQTPDVLRLYGSSFLQVPHKEGLPIVELPTLVAKELRKTETEKTENRVEVSRLPISPKTETPPAVEENLPKVETPSLIVAETPPVTVEKTEPKIETTPEIKPFPVSIYETGNGISWKLGKKKNAKIVFIMDEATFGNSMMLTALRTMVIEEVKIPAEFVVFGTYPNDTTHWELRDMPVTTGLLFTEPIQNQPNPYLFQDKKVFAMGDLKNVILDTKRQEKLKNWLKKYFLSEK
ncbi:MAG: hypothetical protein ACKVTZ_02770 [Bacteroidia bacterium]